MVEGKGGFDVDVIDSTEFPLADFPQFNQGLS